MTTLLRNYGIIFFCLLNLFPVQAVETTPPPVFLLDSAIWKSVGGGNDRKYFYKYDASGNTVLSESYWWYGYLNVWQGMSKEVSAYDANKHRTLSESFQWDATNKKWANNVRIINAFNSSNKQILDESYNWDTSTSAWVGQSKTVSDYNSGGLMTLYESYMWFSMTNNWLGSSRYVYEYDANGVMKTQNTYIYNFITSEWILYQKSKIDVGIDTGNNTKTNQGYIWNDTTSTWETSTKWEYTYNAQNKVIKNEYFEKDPVTKAWVLHSREISDYDVNGNKTLTENYQLSTQFNELYGSVKRINSFNQAGAITLDEVYQWDFSTKAWVKFQKMVKDYSTQGMTLFETYSWNSTMNDWQGQSRNTFTFNSAGKAESQTQYSWDFNGWKWVASTKLQTTYDTNGNITLNENFSWNDATQLWVNAGKSVSVYDSNKNLLSVENLMWNNTSKTWVNYTKTEYTYDSYNNKTKEQAYSWDTGTNAYKVGDKKQYYYSIFTDLRNIVQPTSTFKLWSINHMINIKFVVKATELNIYSVTGVLVKRIQNPDNEISTAVVPGVYIVIANQQSQKIVVQ